MWISCACCCKIYHELAFSFFYRNFAYYTWTCTRCFFYIASLFFSLSLRSTVLHHSYPSDSQLQKFMAPHLIPNLFLSMQQCIDDVKTWMTVNKLKLNDDKTEAMIVSSVREARFFSSSFRDSMTVTLWRTLVLHLTMKTHISDLIPLVPLVIFCPQMPQKFLFLPLFFHALTPVILSCLAILSIS